MFCLLSGPCLAAGPTLEWIRQVGTLGDDNVVGLPADGLGNVYIAGNLANGSFPYPTDGFLFKYGPAGNQLWSRQFDNRTSSSVFVDGTGTVSLADSLVNRQFTNFDAMGNELASRPAPRGSLAADNEGNAYAVRTVGWPEDYRVLEKFDSAGNLLWSRQSGTENIEQSQIVSADSAGDVFVYGSTIESETSGRPRASLTRYDAEGNEYWTRYVESARYVNKGGVVSDGLGNVYITGNSNAPIVEPRIHLGYDAFLAKYDADGNRLWLQEFGTAEFGDMASDVALDGLGNVFVTGTMGDPYLAMFDTDGNQVWLHQFGTPEVDNASHIVADGLGNVFIAGLTRGDLGGPNAGGGGYDVYLAKFSMHTVVPEPSAAVLAGMIVGAFGMFRSRRRSATLAVMP